MIVGQLAVDYHATQHLENTMNTWIKLLTTCSAVGSGLIAGTFFIFSVVIMPVLAKGNTDHNLQVMRGINDVILRSSFMPVFGVTTLLSLVLPCVAAYQKSPGLGLTIAAGAIFLIGVFGVTMFFNVPLNDQLAKDQAQLVQEVWPNYLKTWTMWNHLRTAAATISMALWILAMTMRAEG